ncbi:MULTISPECIES: NusG domain II-containing protein [Eubacterium]|uniref:NusG domain II-containing protein n=1 Tax=Eubacterium album TaxID=2978477 RepID=A0ABT2M4T6_9FIRM|nr:MULTISPECIES: NusG domain II-containing protein [unclassified Eubacterium (in: firmicutes)]MCT7399412.1 NusG domain II-containing protein [Eubacterium sp. LFL-14]
MKLKKYDIIAIICVAVIVIISYITVNLLRNDEADTVVIYVDGKIEKKLDLNKNQEYKVNVDNGYNIIRIKDKKAKIKESDCSNQTCVNMGTISKDGQTLICLPHKVEVTIVSDDKSEVDVIAR